MVALPTTGDMPVIRADFSDQAAWEATCAAIRPPGDSLTAFVEFVDDPGLQGLTTEQILALVTDEIEQRHGCLFVVDEVTMGSPERPVLAVDLVGGSRSSFRVAADALYLVENNLSIGNGDFSDFADDVDDDGVFRGTGLPSARAMFDAMRDALRTTRAQGTDTPDPS